uniref:PH domain-containing protein n=1 Tax=Echeneis naucrates TaxID=173247 RepID=A0A665U637_ECHNA
MCHFLPNRTFSVPLVAAGGFMFKQWKEKYLVLTMEGTLLVCRDAESPPDQVVALQTDCELIVEGKEILDLPKLPPGGRRDCCFALILPQNKFLLLLSDNPDDCKYVTFSLSWCYVAHHPTETTQHHSLHHRQRPPPRLHQ